MQETVHEVGGWLPVAALLEGSRGVWTVLRLDTRESSTRTVREAVEVLDIRGDQAYVRGTLLNNTRVVATGVHRISPGSVVTVKGPN
jgi:hypothetical protein